MESADPAANTAAPATPRSSPVLRGVRAGAWLAAAVLLVVAAVSAWNEHLAVPLEPLTVFFYILPLPVVALTPVVLRGRPDSWWIVAVAGLGAATVAFTVRSWWLGVTTWGVSAGWVLGVAGAAASLTVATLAHQLLCRARPTLMGSTAGTTRPDRPAGRLRVSPPSVCASVAAAVTAVLLVAAPLTARTVLDPLQVTEAAVPAGPAPAHPTSTSGEVAWSIDLPGQPLFPASATTGVGNLVVSGSRGPVVASDSTVTGIDGATGERLWSVEREHGELLNLVMSPDGAHAVLVWEGPRWSTDHPTQDGGQRRILVEAVDTSTGAITARHTRPRSTDPSGQDDDATQVGIQVTDRAVLVGDEAVSLADGSSLWTLDSPIGWDLTTMAGHSTFVTARTCTGTRTAGAARTGVVRTLCDLTLVDDGDPSSTRTLTQVVTDVDNAISESFALVHGWTVRVGDDAQDLGVGDLEAVNIDDGATWPVGASMSPAVGASDTLLVLRPAFPSEPVDRYGLSTDQLAPDRALDPATGEITTAAAEADARKWWWHSGTWPTTDLCAALVLDWYDDRDLVEPTLALVRPDASTQDLTLPDGAGTPARGERAEAIAVPGGVVVTVIVTDGAGNLTMVLLGLA